VKKVGEKRRIAMRTGIKDAIATILAVGLLAVWPAEAQIVYTPTNITIGGPYGSYNLDVNNDGVTDFTIDVEGCGVCLNPFSIVWETPASGNGVVDSKNLKGPARLGKGFEIGPSQTFYGGNGGMASIRACGPYGDKTCRSGNWASKSGSVKGYLGLSFQVSGETFYGWADLTVIDGAVVTLTGYAYESTPGMPIKAGQTE